MEEKGEKTSGGNLVEEKSAYTVEFTNISVGLLQTL